MWEQAALACESALRVTPREEPPRWYFVATLAEAHLHLGDWSAAADDIARMRALVRTTGPTCTPWEESPVWSLWLAAARFESAQRLGLPDQAGRFEEARLSRLESSPFTEKWAQRIRTTLP